MTHFNNKETNLAAAIRDFVAVRSGFVETQIPEAGGWTKYVGEGELFFAVMLFKNGRRIPIPVIDLGWTRKLSLRRIAIFLAGGKSLMEEAEKLSESYIEKIVIGMDKGVGKNGKK